MLRCKTLEIFNKLNSVKCQHEFIARSTVQLISSLKPESGIFLIVTFSNKFFRFEGSNDYSDFQLTKISLYLCFILAALDTFASCTETRSLDGFNPLILSCRPVNIYPITLIKMVSLLKSKQKKSMK